LYLKTLHFKGYESEDSKDVTHIKQQQEEDDDAKKPEEPAKSYANYEQPKSNNFQCCY
jgi:hypothetical protein